MGLFNVAKLFGVTIRESATDGSDFTNPDADYRRLFLGEDGQLHVKDSAGAVTDIGVGSGSVATDAIWDAAGDLAVGSGANTAAKLTKGSDSTVLTISASTHVPVWAAPAAGSITSTSTHGTADQTLSADTPTDVTSCSLSLAAGTWLVLGGAQYNYSASGDYSLLMLTDSSNGQIASSKHVGNASAGQQQHLVMALVSPGSTSTYKLRAQNAGASHGAWKYAGEGTAWAEFLMAIKLA